MRTLVFLVGITESVPDSIVSSVSERLDISTLSLCTTRPESQICSDSYKHVADGEWLSTDMCWETSIDDDKFGLKIAEKEKMSGKLIGLSLIDLPDISIPSFLKSTAPYEIILIGIDSSETTPRETQYNSSTTFDTVLHGCNEVLIDALSSTLLLLGGRGGVLERKSISNLLSAKTLLLKADIENLSTASYDLRLGDDVWCQGKFNHLDDRNPTLKIPPYSYAIVSSREIADLPNYVVARFDLKLSLFFQGVILSNGPQVDPGYKGALFCMLYNGSDEPVGITRDHHFATIEFKMTALSAEGYSSGHQNKTKLSDFIPGHAAVAGGGQILERVLNVEDSIKSEWKSFRTLMLSIVGILIAIFGSATFLTWNVGRDAKVELDKFRLISQHQLQSIIEKNAPLASNPIPANVKVDTTSLQPSSDTNLSETTANDSAKDITQNTNGSTSEATVLDKPDVKNVDDHNP